MHFDAERHALAMPDLSSTAGVEQEWQRLMYLTRKWARYAGREEDPLPADGRHRHLAARGAGLLHPLELGGGPGPGARPRRPRRRRARLRRPPTWFDVPPGPRDAGRTKAVYTGVVGVPREHSHWREDHNKILYHGLNKDWPGRPKYTESYVTAYFASRQWIRAVRTWLGNEPLWQRAMTLPPDGRPAPRRGGRRPRSPASPATGRAGASRACATSAAAAPATARPAASAA